MFGDNAARKLLRRRIPPGYGARDVRAPFIKGKRARGSAQARLGAPMKARRYGKNKKRYRTATNHIDAKGTESYPETWPRRYNEQRGGGTIGAVGARRLRNFRPETDRQGFGRARSSYDGANRPFQRSADLKAPQIAGQCSQPQPLEPPPELSWPPLPLFPRLASRALSAACLTALTPLRPGAFGSSEESSMSS